MLVLVANGWGLTVQHLAFSELSPLKKVLVVVLSVAFFMSYLVLFFTGIYATDPAITIYYYQSVPGALLLVIRALVLFYFLFALWRTRGDSDENRQRFYFIFGVIFGVWFLATPFMVIVGTGIPVWERFKAVTALSLLINTFGYASFVFFMWPSRIKQFFEAIPSTAHAYERL